MPTTRRGPLRAALTVAACSLFALLPAGTAGAALIETGACDDAALSSPFAPWGDHNAYKLAPGGDFEADGPQWRLSSGAQVVEGSEPFGATGVAGEHALQLKPGASAIAPATCVNAAYPTFRFFARSSGGLLGLVPVLKASVIYRDGLLADIALPVGVATLSPSWRPTLPMLTASAVGAAVAGGEAPLAVKLTAVSGTWTVDDVFVDPYSRR